MRIFLYLLTLNLVNNRLQIFSSVFIHITSKPHLCQNNFLIRLLIKEVLHFTMPKKTILNKTVKRKVHTLDTEFWLGTIFYGGKFSRRKWTIFIAQQFLSTVTLASQFSAPIKLSDNLCITINSCCSKTNYFNNIFIFLSIYFAKLRLYFIHVEVKKKMFAWH